MSTCPTCGASKRRGLIAIASVALLVVAILAYGQRFSYSTQAGRAIRVNRYTGNTEVLQGRTWYQAYRSNMPPPTGF